MCGGGLGETHRPAFLAAPSFPRGWPPGACSSRPTLFSVLEGLCVELRARAGSLAHTGAGSGGGRGACRSQSKRWCRF